MQGIHRYLLPGVYNLSLTGPPARLNIQGIHNYLLPGMYNLSLADPSRLLIFYTYSPDNEQAEINK